MFSNSLRFIALSIFALFCLAASPANATDCTGGTPAHTCYWIGGTGTWDTSTTTHWSFTSGGATCSCVPGTADAIIFDGSSGGGTVTPAASLAASYLSLSCGAFTGTLAFNTNNPNISLTGDGTNWFNCSGSGTRTINLGSGTWTISGNFSAKTFWNLSTTTGLTEQFSNATLVFTQTSGSGNGSFSDQLATNPTYGTVTFAIGASGGGIHTDFNNNTTFTTLTLSLNGGNYPGYIDFPAGTFTTTNMSITGGTSANNYLYVECTSSNVSAIFSVSSGTVTATRAILRSTTGSGGATFTATNSIDQGRNSGWTITPPAAGGGVPNIIGG